MATIQANGIDSSNLNGGQHADFKSDSLPEVERGSAMTIEYAGQLEERWNAKQRKAGKAVWVSPFDKASDRRSFKRKKDCMAYMQREQEAQLELAELEGKKVVPIKVIASPKRELSDFVLPGYEFVNTAQDAAAKVARELSGMVSVAAGQRKDLGRSVITRILNTPGRAAEAEIADLETPQLHELHRAAMNRGKRDLLLTVRRQLRSRGEKVSFS